MKRQADSPAVGNSPSPAAASPSHTPGPWSVAPADQARNPFIVVCAEGLSVADCQCFVSQREANARLMAAAPEMLEALIGIVRGLGATEENDGQKAVWRAAFDAIAKASGAAVSEAAPTPAGSAS